MPEWNEETRKKVEHLASLSGESGEACAAALEEIERLKRETRQRTHVAAERCDELESRAEQAEQRIKELEVRSEAALALYDNRPAASQISVALPMAKALRGEGDE